jgi:hypothetical protein
MDLDCRAGMTSCRLPIDRSPAVLAASIAPGPMATPSSGVGHDEPLLGVHAFQLPALRRRRCGSDLSVFGEQPPIEGCDVLFGALWDGRHGAAKSLRRFGRSGADCET